MAAPKILMKWLVGNAPLLCGAGGGFLIGLIAAPYLGDTKFDDSVETVIGAALGAGITVLGTLWAAQFQSSRAVLQYEHLVVEAVKAIQRDTGRLVTVLDRPIIPDGTIAEYAAEIRRQTELLIDGMELFKGLSPFKEIVDYKSRLGLFQFDEELRVCRPTLTKELRWLDNPTIHVLRNTQKDLFTASEKIFGAAKDALSNFDYANKGQMEAPKLSAETREAAGI